MTRERFYRVFGVSEFLSLKIQEWLKKLAKRQHEHQFKKNSSNRRESFWEKPAKLFQFSNPKISRPSSIVKMSNVESETLDYLEVTSRVQSKKVPAPKGNRVLIKRKVDKEYTPLENGDDLLVIQSQEELTLLPAMSENWLIKVIFICSSMIWVIYFCFI